MRQSRPLIVPGVTELPEIGIAVRITAAEGPGEWTVCPRGQMIVRSRQEGDSLTTKGGTKSLKKRFIDRKIPQWERMAVPVIADDAGVLAVMGIGTDVSRENGSGWVRIEFVSISGSAEKIND